MADDFCQSCLSHEKQSPGPMASLQCSEVITLALFGQWVQFPSERAFYRYAQHHLRAAFPHLPTRSQFNRLMRTHRDAIIAFGLHLVDLMQAQQCHYEGFHLLLCVTPLGVITGFGFGAASSHDQVLASTLFIARKIPTPRLPSAGRPAEATVCG